VPLDRTFGGLQSCAGCFAADQCVRNVTAVFPVLLVLNEGDNEVKELHTVGHTV
jgi:hypothetical protein